MQRCCTAYRQTFATHLRAIGESGKDVLALQLRVILQNSFNGCAGSEKIKKQGSPDPCGISAMSPVLILK
jgi:hypothetical protein